MSANPRRNRVTPLGQIVATPEHGLFMGNRGCLHDDSGNIVCSAARPAWIICLPRWPGVKRQLMKPGHYTELFFLDEPTALAAGHRPCGSCRPEALHAFKRAWARGHGLANLPKVAAIDALLDKQRKTMTRFSDADDLPDGIMVVDQHGQIWLRWFGYWRSWTFAGYGQPQVSVSMTAWLITPPATAAVLASGYSPIAHPSAEHVRLPR